MEEIKYYEMISLESIKNIIKDNINIVSRSFLAIGYYLKNVRDRNLYLQDGYKDIWDFAHSEFGISQSWASRYMSINDKFSKDGNSPIIQEDYKGFDKSKLSEMLQLSDEQIKQVSLTTTVAQIKDMKKSYATSHKDEIEEKLAEPIKVESEIEQKKPEPGTIIYGVSGNSKISKYEVVSKYCSFSEKYFTVKDGKGVIHNLSAESEHWHCSKEEAKKDSWYHEKESKPKALESVMESPDIVNEEPENVTDIAEIVTEQQDETELPCDTCNWDVKGCCNYGSPKLDWCTAGDKWTPKVEIVEAEIIHSETYDELSLVKEILDRKQGQLKSWLRISNPSAGEIISIEKAKIEVGALAAYITDIDNIINPIPVPEQPELPILKNNDQRKEWAENYKTWGEWYHDANIDCHYYKYDFINGDKLVVEEYLDREVYWSDEKRNDKQYHLLIKDKKSYGGKRSYEEKYSHQTTSMSEIIEYLKDFQKKGV